MYRSGIVLKTPQEIERMAAAGRIQARCLRMLASKCRPGVTTAELDEAAERFISSQGAVATFKGYRGFPGSICASPNSMVVHGIPGSYALRRGDVISLDVGVTKDGWVADAAMTVPVGPVDPEAQRLLDTTKAALLAGIAEAKPGNHLGDVSHAIQRTVEIEPLANAGSAEVRVGADNWAVYSADGSLAAHFEFTVAVTANGPRILTPWQ